MIELTIEIDNNTLPAQLWKFNTAEDRLENKLHGMNWQYGSNKLITNNFPENNMEGFVEFDVDRIGRQFLGLKGNFSFNAPVVLEDPDNLVKSKYCPFSECQKKGGPPSLSSLLFLDNC